MRRLFLLPVLLIAGAVNAAGPELLPPPPVVTGFAPEVQLAGLPRGKPVRLWTIRQFSQWKEIDGQWKEVPVQLYAWADYLPARGRVDIRRTPAVDGTYRGVDAYGLMWSGRPKDDPLVLRGRPPSADGAMAAGATQVVAMLGDREIGRAALVPGRPEGLRVATMQEGGIAGVYAAPDDGKRHPVMLLLHGSEGGSNDGARDLAIRYAGQGYATLAVMYFAFDLAKVEGVSHQHVNTPIELLDVARQWAVRQPEADGERIGVYGHSKGAEFAEVAAVRYPWIDAVVACVPTDVVWEGYAFDDERNRPEHRGPPPEQISSWSWQGEPLPYVKLRPFNWREPGRYFNNTERYELSRRDDPAAAERAVIPLEQSRARFLLLGGEKDEVWASGDMAQALARQFADLPEERRPEVHVFEGAGHGICGDGTYPPRVYETTSDDPRSKDLDKEGAAAARAWELTVEFLRRELGGAAEVAAEILDAEKPGRESQPQY